jgi:hypothetical protein
MLSSFFLFTPPMKMERHEMLAYKIQMPGSHPEERIQHVSIHQHDLQTGVAEDRHYLTSLNVRFRHSVDPFGWQIAATAYTEKM